MDPAAERHFPDPRHAAGGAGTAARSLCLAVSGQHRPSTAIEFSRIGPNRPETSRRAYSGLDPLSSAHRAGALWVSDQHGRLMA